MQFFWPTLYSTLHLTVNPSVCRSVCLSVTRWYCIKIAQAAIIVVLLKKTVCAMFFTVKQYTEEYNTMHIHRATWCVKAVQGDPRSSKDRVRNFHSVQQYNPCPLLHILHRVGESASYRGRTWKRPVK